MRSLYVDGEMVGHGATWSPVDDLIATCSGEFNGWVFCAQTGAPLQYLDHGMSGDCFKAFFSPDGRFVCTVAGSDVFVRRAADMWTSNIKRDGAVDKSLNAPVIFRAKGIAALSSTGMCAWTDESPMITIVDLNHCENNLVTKLEVSSPVVSLQFEPSGYELLVLPTAEPPGLWNVANGTCLRVFGDQASSRAIWSPDGRFLTTFSNDGKLLLWRTEDGSHLHTFEEPGEVTCASIW
jgi:WD40 repeat protein